MSRVEIAPEMLRWALERSGKPEHTLERKFPKLNQWLSGEISPTLKQLENLAKTTLTPLGFFFLSEPPEEKLPIPFFRTLHQDRQRKPSPNLLETFQIMQRRQAWMREFLISEGQEELLFTGSAQVAESSVLIARRMHEFLGIPDNWAATHRTWEDALRSFREVLENSGILVVVNGVVRNNTHRKLDPHEFRGFVLVDEFAPLVFVNGADSKAAQMFTLAHEIAHVFFGKSAAFDLREMQPANDPVEEACDRVAAEFLVPKNELDKMWASIKDKKEPFQIIARQFKVSVLVAARRALDLLLISKKEFFDFYHDYLDDERRKMSRKKKGGGDPDKNAGLRVGKRFGSAVIQAAREGKLLYSEAYSLTDLYGKTFERYASYLIEGGRDDV